MHYYAEQDEFIYFYKKADIVYEIEKDEENILQTGMYTQNSVAWQAIRQNLTIREITLEQYSQLLSVAQRCLKDQQMIRLRRLNLKDLKKELASIKI